MASKMFADVVVNGVPISATAIAAEAQNHPVPKAKPGKAWRMAARALTIRTLLLAEANKRGLVAAPAEVSPGRFETDEEALIRAVMEEAIVPDAPTDTALEAEWAKTPDRFRAPPLWEASHILAACAPGEHPDAAKAKARADALLTAVKAAPRSFSEIAASESDCGSKANGGALGQLGPGDTAPEFEAVLRDLVEGAMTPEPVRTRYGWHIIRLDAFAEGQPLPFEAVRPKLSAAMEKAAWTKAAKRFVEELVEGAEITGADIRAA